MHEIKVALERTTPSLRSGAQLIVSLGVLQATVWLAALGASECDNLVGRQPLFSSNGSATLSSDQSADQASSSH